MVFFLHQPPAINPLLFGPCMGFEASHAALRYGFAMAKDWLEGEGAQLVRRLRITLAA